MLFHGHAARMYSGAVDMEKPLKSVIDIVHSIDMQVL
jgi:hypothetical protein